jgi:undecaprenyl pyrophosphate phosphatase UppP
VPTLCIAVFLRLIERVGMMPFVIYRLLLADGAAAVLAGVDRHALASKRSLPK